MILVWTAPRTTRRSTSSCCTSTAGCVRSRTCRSATGCTCWAARPRGTNWSAWCWPSCGRTRCSAARSAGCPGLRAALGLADGAPMHEVDRVEGLARALVEAVAEAGWNAAAVPARRQLGAGRGQPRGGRVAGVRLPGGGAAAAGDHRRDHRHPARPGRRIRTGRSVGFAAPRPGQRAAHRPQLLLRRPQGHPVAAGLPDRPGDGRVAAAAASRGDRGVSAVGRPVGVGHLGHADQRRRHRRGAGPARRDAGLGRGFAPGHRTGADPAGRARPARGST